MFRFLKEEKPVTEDIIEDIATKMKKAYRSKLLPLEEYYDFHEFQSSKLEDPDFDAKPMILLVGQYSTGKTTFIHYLLGEEFPGMNIGPEPTTDRFIAVMYDERSNSLPGNALVMDATKQFGPLVKYGNAFLNRLQCSTLKSPVLKTVSIIDTPGILAGHKHEVDRGYSFNSVLEWFAERVDRIILLFDAHKLDISDEFRRCIEIMKGHDDKIRIILNKADTISKSQLMRVYGAMMWSLGKILQSPETVRVYVGSFWDQPWQCTDFLEVFQNDEQELFRDLLSLPRNSAVRKLNDLIKRARLAKTHALIIDELRKEMPAVFGKENKKKELIKNLDKIYEHIRHEHGIPIGDFPDLKKMQNSLQNYDFTKFPHPRPHLLKFVDNMLTKDIVNIMQMIPMELSAKTATEVQGGVFEGVTDDNRTPFGFNRCEGVNAGSGDHEWICNREKEQTDRIFESLRPYEGKISGSKAKSEMVKSKLPNSVLSKIWSLSDVDSDGYLDSEEFALAMHLIKIKSEGSELPSTLPNHLVPPSKRDSCSASSSRRTF